MTQIERTEATIRRLVKEWEPLLDLPGVAVEHRFHNTFLDPANPDATCAQAVTRWQYREAVIHWYMSGAVRQTRDELENTLVHEYVHIMMAPVHERLKAGSEEHDELATENVARALLATRHGGA